MNRLILVLIISCGLTACSNNGTKKSASTDVEQTQLHLPLAGPVALEVDVDVRDGGTGVLVLHHQHAVDHHVGDAPMAVGGDDDVELRAGVGQIGDAGAVDAVLVVGVHVHDAEDNVHLILDLVDDLAALVHGVGDGPALEVLGEAHEPQPHNASLQECQDWQTCQ